MKRFLLILPLLALVLSCGQQAPAPVPVPDSIDDNLYRFGVNTSPYEYFCTEETPVPAGYKPFYISHYGRHGSRSNWDFGYAAVLEKYAAAKEAGLLTEEGEKAFQQMQTINELHNGMNGRLTPLGAQEHRQIAGRLFARYPKLFSGSPRVRAVSSVVPRCIVSMAAFTGELLSRNPKLDMSWDTGEKIMRYCSSDDPEAMRPGAYAIIQEHARSHVMDSVSFVQKVFTDEAAAREAVGGSIAKLMEGTLSFAVIAGSFEQDQTLIDLFNVEDIKHHMRNTSLNLYLRQCNSADFGDIRMAAPGVQELLEDVITKADAAIATGEYVADLRFGHDYQLLAISSRMGIKGVGERLSKEEAVEWPGWLYTPFAGNLQLVFYKNAAGNILVKCFINERETTLLGLPDGPYYAWDDVKKAWLGE